MFNGIIRSNGVIKKVTGDDDLTILEISFAKTEKEMKKGDSIAVDGVCLTIKEIQDDSFTVEVMPETLQRTIIDSYMEGTEVNLELPLKIGERLDGHFTGGHIDYVGTVKEVVELKKTSNLIIDIPPDYRKYFAIKGSVAVNGVSLTIGGLDSGTFTVCIIPQTLDETNIGRLKKGDKVNIETDMFARYIDSLLESKENQNSYAFLKERNFI